MTLALTRFRLVLTDKEVLMSNSTLNLTPALYEYLLSASGREDPLLAQLREETSKDEMARMQIAPEQGQFMQLLVRLINAKYIVEVGTFTGYSSLAMAQAMPKEGRMVCCDVSEKWTNIARRYWQTANVQDQIDLRLAPAKDTLKDLLASGGARTVDLIFIDADKERYDEYYELSLRLLRPGGLMILDNTLWGGNVIKPQALDVDTKAIRALNLKLKTDSRIHLSHLPVADGLTLCLKK